MIAKALITLAAALGAPHGGPLDDERLARALEQWAARENCVLEVRVGVDRAHDGELESDERVLDLSGRPCGSRGEPYVGLLHVRRTAEGALLAYGESGEGRAVGLLSSPDGARPRLLARRAAGEPADVQMLARDVLALLDPARLLAESAHRAWFCTDVEGGDGVLYEGRFGPEWIAPERARHVSVFGEELGDLTLQGIDVAFHVGADGLLHGAHFDVRRVRELKRLSGRLEDAVRIDIVESQPTFVTYDVSFVEATTPAFERFGAQAALSLDAPAPTPCGPAVPAPRWRVLPPSDEQLRAACAWLLPRAGVCTLAITMRRPEGDPPRKRGGLDELSVYTAFDGALVLRRAADGRTVLASAEALDGFGLWWGATALREDVFSGLPRSIGSLDEQLAFLFGAEEFERAVLAASWSSGRAADGRRVVRGVLDPALLNAAVPRVSPWAGLLLDVPGADPVPIPATWMLGEDGRVRELRLTIGGEQKQVATRAMPGGRIQLARRTVVLRPAASLPWHVAAFEERCREREQ